MTKRGSRGTLAGRAALAMTVMVLVTAACASDPTQSEEYTSLQAQYEEASAQLAETQSRLVGAEVALTDSEAELVETASNLTVTEDRVAVLEGAVEAMITRLEAIRMATAAHVSGDLLITMGGFDDVAGSGVATSVGDSLVASYDLPGGSWEAFATDPGWYCWCEQVQELDDPATSAALDWWFDTPVGSEEEFWAWYEVQLRVLGLLTDEIDAAIDDGVATLDAEPVVTAK